MIPDFQALMLPFLNHISDGNEYSTKEILEVLTKAFNLSEDELNQY
jgi:restriction endonuclease Mrr